MPFFRLSAQRAVLLVILLASLFIFSRLIRLRPSLQLYLEMAAETSGDCQAQLYFDRGRDLNEADSIKVTVPTRSLKDFRPVAFSLPGATISQLRFDPMMAAGRFAVRRVQVLRGGKLFRTLKPDALVSGIQIAQRTQAGETVVFQTVPGAVDPTIRIILAQPLRTLWAFAQERIAGVLAAEAVMLLSVLGGWALWKNPAFWRLLDLTSARLTVEQFLCVDRLAAAFYLFCVISFILAVAADLNGSSSGLHSRLYGEGVREEPLAGEPKEIRSDEWVYSTPDILSQALRTNRFEAYDSDLGSHSVALLGNVPVRHFSTMFRPQFWAFFVLPADYGYSFFWQAKGLLLVGGIFTWLLMLTGSSAWSVTGALWFYFSPFTQWTYSWPSALPEMTGLSCLACVCFCYLVTGTARLALVLSAIGAAVFSIDFALCGYPPHLIPLMWVQVFVFVFWCAANYQNVIDRNQLGLRLVLLAAVAISLGVSGVLIYRDLEVAIRAIADTTYPGRRTVAGGTWDLWHLLAHFLPWKLREHRFPEVLGNISEGSGFLWLAPFCVFLLPFVRLSGRKKMLLVGLTGVSVVLVLWLTLPIPASIARLMLLDRSPVGRPVPALGLANVGILAICMSVCQLQVWPLSRRRLAYLLTTLMLAAIGAFLLLRIVNAHAASFFTSKEIFLASAIAGLLITLLVWRQALALAIVLLAIHISSFAVINPIKRGMHVFLDSDLYRFVHSNPSFTNDRWLVFSPNIVRSGFVAGVGCEIYTGTRYLPDIDHFANFRAHGYDVSVLNRLGYLTAVPASKPGLKLINPVVVEWDVDPKDTIIKELGIRYLAFDYQPDAALVATLRPLNSRALDGFWLYEVAR